jgi:hypothetical protein
VGYAGRPTSLHHRLIAVTANSGVLFETPTTTNPAFLTLQRYLDRTVHLLRRFCLRGRGFFRARARITLFRLDCRAIRLRLR